MAARFLWVFSWWVETGYGSLEGKIPLRCRSADSGRIARMRSPEQLDKQDELAGDDNADVCPATMTTMCCGRRAPRRREEGATASVASAGGGSGDELGDPARETSAAATMMTMRCWPMTMTM